MTIKVVKMKPIEVTNDIVPIAAFKARASEIVRSLRSRGRPLIITQNGKPAAVLLSPEDFDRLAYRERFVAAVQEGLADVTAGRVVTDEELDEVLEAEFRKRSR
jgi:prevent-host-death family protein